MNEDIRELLGELSNEEKEELKRFRMEYLKKLMIEQISNYSGSEASTPQISSYLLIKEQQRETFEKIYLYIPISFKKKITDLKSTGTPVTNIMRNKVEIFFNSFTGDFGSILDKYKKYFTQNEEKRENLACSIKGTKIHRIKNLSEEFNLSKRWIIETILYYQLNQTTI